MVVIIECRVINGEVTIVLCNGAHMSILKVERIETISIF